MIAVARRVQGLGRSAIVAVLLMLAACGGSGNSSDGGFSSQSSAGVSSSSSQSSISVSSSSSSVSSVPATVNISGTVGFDYVPISKGRGLNYAATRVKPVRLANVYLIDAAGEVVDSSQTDAAGYYTLQAPVNTQVKVQVAAVSESNAAQRWEIRVEDNTMGNALYVLEGQLRSSGTVNSVRDLRAASGWTGSDYTEPRAAGPFAILDSAYMAVQKLAEVDANLTLPVSIFRWSVNNTTAEGLLADGDIVTSFYNGEAVYILGQADVDTDEYDAHVVVHEWSHFFEYRVGQRSNSIGGDHSGLDKLDMRVAYSEGFANGIAGYVLSDPEYQDSFRLGQEYSAGVDLSRKDVLDAGWYSETSIQTIFYHLADSGAFEEIYGVLTDALYTAVPAFTSIFSFADIMATRYPAAFPVLDTLMSEQSITGRDQFGAGETNSGGTNGVLPLYVDLLPDGSETTVCSTQINGSYNKLGIHQFLKTTVLSGDNYQLVVENNGDRIEPTDPDVAGSRNALQWRGDSGVSDSEVLNLNLQGGTTYAFSVNDYAEHIDAQSAGYQPACFNVSLTPQ
ncbi:hypothetical protein [Gilvimarinus polysaccharolyticus]|uniref:hypothetical protein n=1 Tax=Gilvimarinus polysaccharolyticus TaxID=863921 RepID=UPI0018DCF12B|nr:hypothetical protein [Gilvimarinus polysaccharolyticus]